MSLLKDRREGGLVTTTNKGGTKAGKTMDKRIAANVQGQIHHDNRSVASTGTTITSQQLEQLLKLLPTTSRGGDTDEEIDGLYAGMVSCHFVDSIKNKEWIIDSGASDHMTGMYEILRDVGESQNTPKINLPTGETSLITHSGNVKLNNNMELKKVLCVPTFKHNLLSVNKLCCDENCNVVFHADYCIIQDKNSNEVKGIGRGENGLYYLINEPIQKTLREIKAQTLSNNYESKKNLSW